MADVGSHVTSAENYRHREPEVNGDYLRGTVGEISTSSIDISDEEAQTFPHMEEMLKVATDLQGDSSLGDRELESTSNTKGMNSPSGYSYNPNNASEPAVVRQQSTSAKIDNIKKWSVSTYKCTRQYLSEKFGKGTRTVDNELEAHIQVLRDTQNRYNNVLKLSKALTLHMQKAVETQRALGECFAELGIKSPELQDEFNYNSETQKILVKNGETLLGALNFFTSNLTTLIHKTMEDTLVTVKAYESARIEYDAYRNDMEALDAAASKDTYNFKLEETRRQFEQQKEKFDKLRSDVAVKLKFLDENKLKVMQKQLVLFHNAITAYFAGNKQALESVVKDFHIKVKNGPQATSFLEH